MNKKDKNIKIKNISKKFKTSPRETEVYFCS